MQVGAFPFQLGLQQCPAQYQASGLPTSWLHFCREKYIEQQMEKRLGKQKKAETEEPESQADRDERELYTIPDDLKVGCKGHSSMWLNIQT